MIGKPNNTSINFGLNCKNPSVLVVEDEALIALDLTDDLERWGCNVTDIVSNLNNALAAAEKFRPDFALVDISLECGDDGIELAKCLKDKYGMSIIFITAHSDHKTKLRITTVNPLGYLFKPYSPPALKSMLSLELSQNNLR